MSEAFTFALLGGIIFTGFLASKFFEKTKISEVLILMLAGFLLGPGLFISENRKGKPTIVKLTQGIALR